MTTPTEPNKGGAPRGNANRLTHGVRSYLAIGRLPKGASYIRRTLGLLRTAIESAVQEAHGEISIVSAALVQSAIRHEARCALLTRYLRDHDDSLTLSDRLGVLKQIGDATDSRDRCLRGLDLPSKRNANIWETLYEEQSSPTGADEVDVAHPHTSEPTNGANASNGVLEPHSVAEPIGEEYARNIFDIPEPGSATRPPQQPSAAGPGACSVVGHGDPTTDGQP